MRYDRAGVGADLICDITVRSDAVGTDNDQVDFTHRHEVAGGIIRDHRMLEAIQENSRRLSDARITSPEEAQAIIDDFMGFIGYLQLMGLITIVVTMLAASNAIAMSVRERTREIGLLRALGYTPGLILLLILIESIALAAVGVGGIARFGWLVPVALLLIVGVLPTLFSSTLGIWLGLRIAA